MTNNEIKTLIEECKSDYSTHKSMYEDEQITKNWFKTLAKYDKEDVYNAVRRHKEGAYSRSPIVLVDLTRDLRTIEEKGKENFDSYLTLCKNCGRVIKSKDYDTHFDRCMSVDYIIREYPKYTGKHVTRASLWELSPESFNEKYNNFLKIVLEKSNSEREKMCIRNYFSSMEQL